MANRQVSREEMLQRVAVFSDLRSSRVPVGMLRGFRNKSEHEALMLTIVGGTDPGKSWRWRGTASPTDRARAWTWRRSWKRDSASRRSAPRSEDRIRTYRFSMFQ